LASGFFYVQLWVLCHAYSSLFSRLQKCLPVFSSSAFMVSLLKTFDSYEFHFGESHEVWDLGSTMILIE
jgi:hypothetical protein